MNKHSDLEISRLLAAPRAKLWKAWSDPKLLAEWWCPKPWKTEVRQFDFRTGGAFYTFMTGPDGNGGQGESDNPGIFLEVTPMERIIGTSCLVEGWRPATPWLPMTMIISFADEGAGTRYVARVLHKDAEDAKKHEDMGFHDGWNTCITQLEELAKTL
ncbi:MAG: SRPBCC family protein [Caulobacterales bacterium]